LNQNIETLEFETPLMNWIIKRQAIIKSAQRSAQLFTWLIEQGIVGIAICFSCRYAQKIYHRTNQKFGKVADITLPSIILMQCVLNYLSDMIEAGKVGSVFYLCIAALVISEYQNEKRSKSFHER
jgi:hypothetical protein